MTKEQALKLFDRLQGLTGKEFDSFDDLTNELDKLMKGKCYFLGHPPLLVFRFGDSEEPRFIIEVEDFDRWEVCKPQEVHKIFRIVKVGKVEK